MGGEVARQVRTRLVRLSGFHLPTSTRAESLGEEFLCLPAGDEHQGRQARAAHHPRMAVGIHQESLRLGGPAPTRGPGGTWVDELLRPVLPDEVCADTP